MTDRPDVKSVVSELVRRTNENSRRVRTIEQRIDKMEASFSTLEEKALTQLADLKISLERIGGKIASVSDRISEIESDIMKINKDLGKSASKAEIKQLETYIELVNPITSKFVTRDEMERMLEDRIAKKA